MIGELVNDLLGWAVSPVLQFDAPAVRVEHVDKPIGVAQWATRLVETLPADLEGSLPTVAQIEAELGDGE